MLHLRLRMSIAIVVFAIASELWYAVWCGGNTPSASPVGAPAEPPSDTIPRTYFGLHIHGAKNTPWPEIPFGAWRLWDAGVPWAELETASGRWDFSTLDREVNLAEEHGVDILMTFGETPTWASSNPSDATCGYAAGACDPPKDLNSDGTGTNQHWKDYVTAIATHGLAT